MDRNKRLLKEWELWSKNHPENIWIEQIDDQIDHIRAMILGPEGSPSHLGFFVFDITYPIDYPNSAPKVKFLNTNSNIRIHPNLYGTGKVCLSILGTWSGPGWTRVMRTETVLVSIQSLLGMQHPIQGEPGYEKETSDEYNEYIRQATLDQFIDKSIFGDIIDSPFLKEISSNYFKDNKESYMKLLEKARESEKTKFSQGRPHISTITMNYEKIKKNFLRH